ncbi:gamma-glutamylcyclotransferase, partial [bacterium]
MFYYFGYGSNLSVPSLRAKGVDPLSSEPAILDGWRLSFDLPDFFAIEGGTGNIQRSEPDAVHGVLHGCRNADLARLDSLEAVGISYERIEGTVTTYSGKRARAFVYVGLPSILDGQCLPSERYKNILVRGASDMRLDARYIDRLRALATCPLPEARPFALGEGAEAPVVRVRMSLSELASRRELTGFAGFVFDMSRARPRHAYLKQLLGGKDVTLLFLKRMDSSDGSEDFEDVRVGRYTEAQRRYLDAYLHEFAREYQLLGTLDYLASTDAEATGVLGAG